MEVADRPTGHWATIARSWAQVRPPLRPSPEEAALVAGALGDPAAPDVLVLGVTPELHDLEWPEGTTVRAVDRSRPMIDHVWPGPPTHAVQGDWTALPLAAGSIDLAACDGGLHLLPWPDGQHAVVEEVGRVLRPDGVLVVRLFTPPPVSSGPDEVLADLGAGRVPDPNHLKVRLWMALAGDPRTGVGLADVWELLRAAHPDLDALSTRLGWDPAGLRALESYRGSSDRYHLVDRDTAVDALTGAPGGFALEAVHEPRPAVGFGCPTLVLRRRR